MPNLGPKQKPELIFGLVAAVGTDLDAVESSLRAALSEVGYTCNPIRVIYELRRIEKWQNLGRGFKDQRYKSCMDAGTEYRELTKMGDALAILAIARIRAERQRVSGDPSKPIFNCAHLLHSLKTPEEVETLRKIYGPSFIVVAAYSPAETRLMNLATTIAESHKEFHTSPWRPAAEELVQRDQIEEGKKFGQHVRETFWRGDVFIDVSDRVAMQSSVKRFIRLLFGDTFQTPSRDEYCMFHAKAAALRSASLSRQVGAAIATENGDIIAVGTNEVPRAGGGLYWAGDSPDNRDFVRGYDISDKMRVNLLGDVLKRLKEDNWFIEAKAKQETDELVKEALAGCMKGAKVMDLIEFQRSVHAEMAALIDAARRGAPLQSCTLYTTTFPCHDCAKHVVAAGIQRVVYVEPYPKSLTPELYPDSIAIDSSQKSGNLVECEAFVGVAPKQYLNLFMMKDRKNEEGSVIQWDPNGATPRVGDFPPSYDQNEQIAIEILHGAMDRAQLRIAD